MQEGVIIYYLAAQTLIYPVSTVIVMIILREPVAYAFDIVAPGDVAYFTVNFRCTRGDYVDDFVDY